jgi:hypothetical protein
MGSLDDQVTPTYWGWLFAQSTDARGLLVSVRGCKLMTGGVMLQVEAMQQRQGWLAGRGGESCFG